MDLKILLYDNSNESYWVVISLLSVDTIEACESYCFAVLTGFFLEGGCLTLCAIDVPLPLQFNLRHRINVQIT